ncbi:MAG: hypothetical protein L3K04_05230 [Thermoplasmata archaeon]|nr:hypothetical protein [Thermoplasmata archaeon]
MGCAEGEGSTFDAPIDNVWKYLLGSLDHDGAHATTRNPRFEEVSEISMIYAAQRKFHGTWAPGRMRISLVAPASIVTEWLAGPLAGSKLLDLYSPRGSKTQTDVHEELTSKPLPLEEVEAAAREWLESAFNDDAPAVRALAQQK